jgi:hypothetical protein
MITLTASINLNHCGQLYAGILLVIYANKQEIKLAALNAL